jgi:hypothetical protein
MFRSFRLEVGVIALVISMLCGNGLAATAQRTFVASIGNDANACSLAAPCRSFGTALTQTSPGGEVIVLDSAGYGPVSVTKAVSIIAPDGVYAGVSVFSADGISVNAPGAVVRLRGLAVNNQTTTGNGISDIAAKELHVEHCQISGFTGTLLSSGVAVVTSADPSQVTVTDSTLSDNSIGVGVGSTGGTPLVSVERSHFKGNNVAVGVLSPSRVTVHGSQMISTKALGFGGIYANPGSSGPTEIQVDDSAIDGAYIGIDASLGSAFYVSVSLLRTAVTHATIGMSLSGGAQAAMADSSFTHDDTAVIINAGSTLYTGGTTYMAFNPSYVTGAGTFVAPAGNF